MSSFETKESSELDGNDLFRFFIGGMVVCGLIINLDAHYNGDKSDIYRCDRRGREVSLLERNNIVKAIEVYARQPGFDLEWDPNKVVCTVNRDGAITFHLEESQEELVDTALNFVNAD